MSSSDNKKSLFGINFDIGTPISIELKHQKSRTVIKARDKDMTRKNFSYI